MLPEEFLPLCKSFQFQIEPGKEQRLERLEKEVLEGKEEISTLKKEIAALKCRHIPVQVSYHMFPRVIKLGTGLCQLSCRVCIVDVVAIDGTYYQFCLDVSLTIIHCQTAKLKIMVCYWLFQCTLAVQPSKLQFARTSLLYIYNREANDI